MPTESKSETPRTDKEFDIVAMLMQASGRVKGYPLFKKYIDGTPLENDAAVWIADFCLGKADFARQLEKELNEAKRECVEYFSEMDTARNQRDDLAKENEQLRIECQQNNEASYIWDMEVAISERNTLAKENKVMREALKLADDIMATWYSSEYIEHPKRMVVLKALNQPNTTNLIVLTRDELIAEIEKLACGCRKALDNRNPHSARVVDIPCERCQLVAKYSK